MHDRRHARVPITLAVGYRTAGAFLVSYSINLSKGGIFIETTEPLEIGTPLELKLEVPGLGNLKLHGVVAWVRKAPLGELPPGMGVRFESLDGRYGEIIDDMVRRFAGLTLLVVAASPDRLTMLARSLRSIVSCNIIEATSAAVAEVAFESRPDLAVVDLDVEEEMGLRALARAKADGGAAATPVIVMAASAETRQKGLAAGADEVLATPPSYHDLQAAVIRTLSRPATVLK